MGQEIIKNIQDIVISNAPALVIGASGVLFFLLFWLAMRGIRLWYWKTDQKLDAIQKIDKKVTELKEELSANNAFLNAHIALQGQCSTQHHTYRIEGSTVNIENKSIESEKELQTDDVQTDHTKEYSQTTVLRDKWRTENDNSFFSTNTVLEGKQKTNLETAEVSKEDLISENKRTQNQENIEILTDGQQQLKNKKRTQQAETEIDIIESLHNLKQEPMSSTNIYRDRNCGMAKDGNIYTREQITATIKI